MHYVNTMEAAENVKSHLDEESCVEENGDTTILRLGLSDVADELGPAVDEAIKKRRQ